jgi:serine/threonine protein kinase
MNLTVGKYYKLTKKLNSGSFGEIYLAINLMNNREVAVKLEPLKTKHPQL